MICCTILGIAVFAIFRQNYLLRNARTRDPKKKDKDFISQLPDEILVSIISRTSTKDSIRTSVLSKRWRDLYKSVPNVNLSCDDLVIKRGNDDRHNSFVMTNRLRHYLLLRSGSKIHSFSLRCCRPLPQDLESFIYSLARLEVEELDLLFLRYHTIDVYFIFHFSCHLLYEMQSLKYLHLKSCYLTPNLRCQKFCNSLQTLVLSSVEVAKGALECIFSNCLSLDTLKIEEFKLCYFSKLCISGPNLRLKSLQINTCKGLQEMEFYAPNLVRFELINSERVDFIFNHVPQLQTIFLHFSGYNSISYIRGTLAKDLPHLKSLSFITGGDFYQESIRYMDIFAFSNLRRLDFSLKYKTKIDLLSLIPFLQSCPILQEFHLNTSMLLYSGAQVRKNLVVVPHKELQSVEITGFCGAKNEMEFALYIVKNAVALEKIHIFRCGKKYMGLDRWSYTDDKITWSKRDCEMIHKQLKGETVSKKAQILVQSVIAA